MSAQSLSLCETLLCPVLGRWQCDTSQTSVTGGAHLPQEEVAEAHLSRGADEQVRIGRVAAVQALAEQRLRDVAANTKNETTT